MIALNKILPILITFLLTAFLTFAVMKVTTVSMLKQEIVRLELVNEKQNVLILELAKIEKYKIENTFDKIKTSENGNLVLSIDSKLQSIKNTTDSTVVKKSLWKRVFN